MTAFPWTITRRAFWAFDLGAEASGTGGFLLPLGLGVPLWFRHADILLVGVFPPTVSAPSSPCIWARPSQFCMELGLLVVYPRLFLESGHGRTVFLCVPRVARWSHSVAELLLGLLAVAGIQMGGLRVLILASRYVEAGVPRSVLFGQSRVLLGRSSQSPRMVSPVAGRWCLGVASWPALQRLPSQSSQRWMASSHHPPKRPGKRVRKAGCPFGLRAEVGVPYNVSCGKRCLFEASCRHL